MNQTWFVDRVPPGFLFMGQPVDYCLRAEDNLGLVIGNPKVCRTRGHWVELEIETPAEEPPGQERPLIDYLRYQLEKSRYRTYRIWVRKAHDV